MKLMHFPVNAKQYPFYNMLLCSPATGAVDVARRLAAFDEVLQLLCTR